MLRRLLPDPRTTPRRRLLGPRSDACPAPAAAAPRALPQWLRPRLLAGRRATARPPSAAPQPRASHRVPGRCPSVAPRLRATCRDPAWPPSTAPPASTPSLGGVQSEIHRLAKVREIKKLFHMLAKLLKDLQAYVSSFKCYARNSNV